MFLRSSIFWVITTERRIKNPVKHRMEPFAKIVTVFTLPLQRELKESLNLKFFYFIGTGNEVFRVEY